MGNQSITVEIVYKDGEKHLETPGGKSLAELIRSAGTDVVLPCGGAGRCGECRGLFEYGAPSPNSWDRRFLSEKELSTGIRLLCRCVLSASCRVKIFPKLLAEEEISAQNALQAGNTESEYDRCAIAIDLGTTTIAAALVGYDQADGSIKVVDTKASINHQRAYGSDVISRIAAAEDSAAELRNIVIRDIEELTDKLTAGAKKTPELICLAGNTTMLYLLCGHDTKELGRYPYNADFLKSEELEIKGIRALTFPGISAFVGADIVSGVYSLDMINDNKRSSLLIDIGTNGEIVFFDKEKLHAASTAAGPVFEGGGISCGTASVPGAISHISIENGVKKIDVIGGGPPIGLCGTGVIEIVSELLRAGIIDRTGLMDKSYFEGGYPVDDKGDIYFTQNDVRGVQLAKAAVYSGLMAVTGGKVADIVYISGGFGTHINIDKITNLGMFPDRFNGKMVSVGNSSVDGCKKYIGEYFAGREEAAKKELDKIVRMAEVTALANDDGFNAEYIEAMNF